MTLYDKRQPDSIRSMFDAIAPRYDLTNGILSLQLHHYWNQKLISSFPKGLEEETLADLCCGTGEIAFRWLQKDGAHKNAYLVDFSHEMLACAKAKAKKLQIEASHAITYVATDVHALPLPDEMCHYAAMAYGIRNVNTPLTCFKEVHRILKPGGEFRILELTRPKNRFLRFGHRIYLKSFLPLLGKLLTTNQAAYKYLGNSISEFIDPANLAYQLKQAGFSNIAITPLSCGIATIIAAQKK